MKYIIVASIGKFRYFLKVNMWRGDMYFQWQGLIQNAQSFAKEKAEELLEMCNSEFDFEAVIKTVR